MPEKTPILRLVEVSKAFGKHTVFDSLSLDIHPGSSVLIQGPSGCGKTTLLRCMALLEPIRAGHIEFEGRVVLRPDSRPRPDRELRLAIAMVFQQLHLWPHLTVLENVALPLRLVRHAQRSAAHEQALDILHQLEIADKGSDFPVSLSGGQQQRVAIARALVHKPHLLLLDEITANLDEVTSQRVLEAVEKVWKQGTTVVTVSHAPWIPNSLRATEYRYGPEGWNLTSFTQ